MRIVSMVWLVAMSSCSSMMSPGDGGETTDAGELRDAGCLRDLDCNCPTPLCDLGTGECREWGADAGGVDRVNPPVPTNWSSSSYDVSAVGGSSCGEPRLLPIWKPGDASGVASRASGCGRQPCNPPIPTNDERGSCSPGPGRESVYLVRLCEPRNIVVAVGHDTFQQAYNIAYVRTGICQGPELVCRGDEDPLSPTFITLTNAPADDYYIVLDDAFTPTWGSVRLTPPGCNDQLALALDAGIQTIDLTARGNDVDLFTLCQGQRKSGGKDVALRFELPTTMTFHARAKLRYAGGMALYRDDCSTSSLLQCSPFEATSGNSALDSQLDAGTYLLVLESTSTPPTVELEAWVEP